MSPLLSAPTWADVRFPAIGTDVHVLVTEPALLPEAEAVARAELDALDRACSRFRPDSELLRLHGTTSVSTVLAEALTAALDVARDTDGLVVPTLGGALRAAGYDRTFTQLPMDGPAAVALPVHPDAWREVRVDGCEVTVPPGAELDLGATAKAWAADRIAARLRALGTGALVNLGGDLAVVGPVPSGGWSVEVGDRPVGGTVVQVVAVSSGGMATSSTTARRWQRGGVALHHVLDPATGLPAPERWASVTVAAPTCLQANAASTAAVVLGPDAPAWLEERGLPAVLLGATGDVVRVAGWPEEGAR